MLLTVNENGFFDPFGDNPLSLEESLDRANAFFRTLLEWAPSGIFLKGRSSRFIAASHEVAGVMGAGDPANLVGKSDHDFYPKEQADRYRAEEQTLMETGVPLVRNLTLKMSEGQLHRRAVTKVPVTDSRGNVIGLVGFVEEAGSESDTGEVLRESEERFTTIFRHAPIALAIFRAGDGEIIEVNNRFVEEFSYRRSELLGRTATELVLHADPAEQEHLRDRLRRRQRVESVEIKVNNKRGSVDHVLLSIAEIALKGEPHYLAMVIDITARKAREEQIREQAQLLDIASDAIIVCDMRSQIRYWNRSAQRLFGWTAEEAIGKDGHQLLQWKHPGEAAEALRIVLERESWWGDMHYTTKDGQDVLGEVRWTLARGERGAPSAILSVITDVTERRSLEAQLLRAQRLESLGTLAGGIAHDLNNVLTPILVGMDSLATWITAPEGREMLAAMRRSTERGAAVVRQILDFTRGAAGERDDLDLGAVLSEVAQIARETFPKSIEISLDTGKVPCIVSANATQMHQLAMNLVVNARDAMPGGGRLTMTAGLVHLDESAARMHLGARPIDYALLRVEDTGTGMSPEILDKIFDPFFTTKEAGKGTGLGLATTLSIVKAHDGFIAVRSEQQRGSTFEVYLPAGLSPARADRSAADLRATHRGAGELLLVVDDEEAILSTTKLVLELAGYRVVAALRGNDAIKLYREHQGEIRVVLTDLMMPEMDGLDLIRRLREIDSTATVVAMSGFARSESFASVNDLPIQGFVAKPFTGETLLKTLHEALRRRAGIPEKP